MSLRRLLAVIALPLALAFAAPAEAAPSEAAASFVDKLVHDALSAIDNKQTTQEERTKRFHDLLDKNFDMARISHFVLGRYWNSASEQERQEFLKLFTEYVVRSYAQRFSEYSGETVKITGSRADSETSAVVQSQVVRTDGGPPAKVDWRVRKDDQGFRIVDVDVEGVSMIVTQREEFGTVMQRQGGVGGLNKTLQEKLASGDTSLAAPILPKK